MKLITQSIATAMMTAYEHSAETGKSGKDVLAKYFTPWAGCTWYISEGMPVDKNGTPCAIDDAVDWHLFGFCDLGNAQCAELGYVMLSDLEGATGPGGLKIERDLYYSGTMAEVLEQYGRAA